MNNCRWVFMHIIFQFSFMLESGTGHKTALHGHVGNMHVFLSCFNFVVFCLMILRYSLPCLSLILCVRQPRLYPPLSYHPPVILFVDFSPNPCNEACIYGLANISNAVEFSVSFPINRFSQYCALSIPITNHPFISCFPIDLQQPPWQYLDDFSCTFLLPFAFLAMFHSLLL